MGLHVVGATSANYAPTADQIGERLTVEVTSSKAGYASATARSAPSAAVTPGTLKMLTKPAIRGKLRVGSTVSVTAGSWSPAAITKVQWLVSGRPVAGAAGKATRLKLTAKMVGKRLQVVVTATSTVIGFNPAKFTTAQSGKVSRR